MDVSNGYMWKKKKRCQVFPWMKDILEKISKSFPNIHESTALQSLHECVEKEFQAIFANEENERAGNLYVLLSTFFINFCWKMKWKEDEKHLKDLATKLLCYLLYLDIYLCKNDENSKTDRLLFIFKLLPDNSIVYDALLLINNLNDKEIKFFGSILRYVLCRERLPSISDPIVYIKVLLLFRRLKQMIQKNKKEAVVFIASTIAQPPDTRSWLISLHLEDVSNLEDTNIVELIFNKSFSKNNLQILRKAVLNEEYLAWIKKLQNIKTELLSPSIPNIQGEKCEKISKDRDQNGRNGKKSKKDVKKDKPKAKSSKNKSSKVKNKTISDDLHKRKRKKTKQHKKSEKLSKSGKKASTSKTRKNNDSKKVLSIHENEVPVPDSRMDTETEWLDHCIVCEKNKETKQIASDCENENQKSIECDSMNKLESSLSKDSCNLNQSTVINSEPSSVPSSSINKPELSTSQDIYKCDLFEPDNNEPFVEDTETLNSISDMNEYALSSSKDPCQLNISTVDNFSQCDNDCINSIDVINETELFCLQESCHLTQAIANDRRKEAMTESFMNMPTIISEFDDRQNESVTESPRNMPVLIPQSLENNAEDAYGNVDMATVAELKQSQKKDCQTDRLIMNSNDYFTAVENYILDKRNFCNMSGATNFKNVSEALQTAEKQFDERSCQTDELIMSSNEYLMAAGNHILHQENQSNVLFPANRKNALPINENEPYNSNALENILSEIKLGESFQMNQYLPEIEDSNCMIPPSQDISYRLLNRAGSLRSNKAIHENLPSSETEGNSNLNLDETNITTIKKQKIPDKMRYTISRNSQSSDTDVTEILPIINGSNNNQSNNELYLGGRMLNTNTQILETNTGIHLQRPLCGMKNNHSVNHSTPADVGKKSYFVEHFQNIMPTSVSSEDASHLSCELSSTDCEPEAVPGHDRNSSSCKRKISLNKHKRCTKKSLFKPNNNSNDKNGTIINHYNISKTPLTSIDDIIADINKLESNIHANRSCLQNSNYHLLNQNEMSKTKNSYSLAEQKEEYNCCKENVCNECTNISPSVSDDNLNQMIQSHNRLINVYNIVYVGSNMCEDAAVSPTLLTEGDMNTSSNKDSIKKRKLSHSSVQGIANVNHLASEADENIFLMKSNANMPNIANVMSSTVHLENNIANSANFIFNQNLHNGTSNRDNPEIMSHSSTTLFQDTTKKPKCSSKPNNVSLNTGSTKNLCFQQNSLNSNCQEHNRAKATVDSCHNNHNFTSSSELQIKILNSYTTQDCVIHPASQFRVNLGKRLPESKISSYQNQLERAACVNSPMLPRQSTNKFLDGVPITPGHKKSYPNQSEMNHGINNKSLVETQENNGNILSNPKTGESILSNEEITKDGANNVKRDSNSQTSCPRISTDGFTTDGSVFHSPDSSDSNSSFESTHSKKSKKSSPKNLPPSVGCWGKASTLKPSKFHIYSCDNDSDTSSDDFVQARKRPAPENKTEKNSCKRKVPVNRQRKRTLFNESRQYFLRSRDSISAPKRIADEIL